MPLRSVLIILFLLLFTSSALVAAPKKEFIIITSFYPVYIHTLNITKEVPGVKVINLVKPSVGCLHDYELTADDMKHLSKADVFIINGAGMEAFTDKLTRQMPRLKIIDASRGITLIPHGKGSNSHLWLSPLRAEAQVRTIAGELARMDGGHKALYMKNAKAYGAEIHDLDRVMREGLKTVNHRNFISAHSAFDYLAEDFGLHVAAVIRFDPSAEPSARELAAIISLIRKKNVKTIFTESQYPEASARTIAQETGAKTYMLDTIVSGPAECSAYIRAMKKNLTVLQDALK